MDSHCIPEDTFKRRLERFPLAVQQEVAQKVVNLLFDEGDASHSEQLLMDEARAFVCDTWNFQANNRAVTFWRLGQLIQRRAYHPGVMSAAATDLWNFLAGYDYSERDDLDDEVGEPIGDTLVEVTAPSRTSSSEGTPSGGGGLLRRLWEMLTD